MDGSQLKVGEVQMVEVDDNSQTVVVYAPTSDPQHQLSVETQFTWSQYSAPGYNETSLQFVDAESPAVLNILAASLGLRSSVELETVNESYIPYQNNDLLKEKIIANGLVNLSTQIVRNAGNCTNKSLVAAFQVMVAGAREAQYLISLEPPHAFMQYWSGPEADNHSFWFPTIAGNQINFRGMQAYKEAYGYQAPAPFILRRF